MATGELLRPGVEVIQTFRKPAPTFVRPTLASCVVGPAFEVIDVLNTDATINSKALYGSYLQMAKAITQSSFPNPRGNIDELDVIENTVRPFLLAGGRLSELLMEPTGSSFLATAHVSSKAAIRTADLTSGGVDLNNKVIVLAFDVPTPVATDRDITVTFVGTGVDFTGNLTAADVVAQINAAVGETVASQVITGGAPTDVVQIASPSFGALSSVTVRGGGSANTLLHIGYVGSSPNTGERVEGSGFRIQDPANNTTQGSWIEFFVGSYLIKVGAGSWTPGAFDPQAGRISVVDGAFASSAHPSVTFTGPSADFPILPGDYLYADGVRVAMGEVMKVESARFKIGTINTDLSVADTNGDYLSKVYNTQSFGTIYDGSAFAPALAFFQANGLNWLKSTSATAATLTGGTAGTDATQAEVTTTVGTIIGLVGMKLHYIVTIDGVEIENTFTFTSAPATASEVATAIGINIPGVLATGEDVGPTLTLTTLKSGRLQGIAIQTTGTLLANDQLGFSTTDVAAATNTAIGKDVEFANISGKSLLFQLDDNAHIYTANFSSKSLDLAIEEVNTVCGGNVASKDALGTKMVLTSTLKGKPSRVKVLAQTPAGAEGSAAGLLNLSATVATGAGRPFPDAYVDDSLVLHIGAQMLRDPVTGYPLDPMGSVGQIHIQYKALRKDVSASAKVPGVLKITDPTILSSVLDPLTEQNPLGLGTFLCMLNAPTFEVKALGIDEVAVAAPDGTEAAWARAAAMLEAEEVYAIAPLTRNEVVLGMWAVHATVMSDPAQGGERIVFLNKAMPTRKNAKIAISGSQANSTATLNQILLDGSPAQGLLDAGVNPGLPFSTDKGVYAEFSVDGQVRRYNVSSVSGSLANFRLSFGAGENTDAFYSTVPFTETLVNAAYALKVRGASLVVPGSNPVRYDWATMAETIAEANSGTRNRRVYSVFPDTVKTIVQGSEKSLPGYYACACLAGMTSAQPPQQGFTNFPITGLTGVMGTEKFTKRQLNIMAGGGTFILMQEVVGGAVFCRHQVSTDGTSIETRELSITKVVDFVAKFLRLGVRKYIGTNNVTSSLLDSLGATIHAILKFLEEAGVLNGSNINNIVQDANQPDTVLIDVTLDVPFPCNYIRLTLVI
jgi:hypothetical protein